MKKIPLIHGKFRAKNNPMKFHFTVFMGHEMIFMGFSREIHGIFIKLQFIVVVASDMFGHYLAALKRSKDQDLPVLKTVRKRSSFSKYNSTSSVAASRTNKRRSFQKR